MEPQTVRERAMDERVDERSWARARSLRNSSDLNDELGVGVGEALELVLVQVHDEEFVCGRQLHRHLGELLVKVANIAARLLPQREERESHNREGEKDETIQSADDEQRGSEGGRQF